MIKNCGSCKRWVVNKQMTRVGVGRGHCTLMDKETRYSDMKGCFMWLEPSEEESQKRLELGLMQLEQ